MVLRSSEPFYLRFDCWFIRKVELEKSRQHFISLYILALESNVGYFSIDED